MTYFRNLPRRFSLAAQLVTGGASVTCNHLFSFIRGRTGFAPTGAHAAKNTTHDKQMRAPSEPEKRAMPGAWLLYGLLIAGPLWGLIIVAIKWVLS